MKKTLINVGIILLIFIIFAGGMSVYLKNKQEKESKIYITKTLSDPNFKAVDLQGKRISLNNYKNKKVVLLNFWASWCPPCRAELPDMAKVYDNLKSKGLVIIGVAESSSKSDVEQLVKQNKIKYPIIMDTNGSIANLYGGINAVPTDFLIDKNGNIVNKQVGMFFGENSIKDFVKPYLDKNKGK
jgi:peroxiredoxin